MREKNVAGGEVGPSIGSLGEAHGPSDDPESSIEARVAALEEQVEALIALVGGRNKSAPMIRNMTDVDARRVLDGDLREMSHKAAAAAGGLTYAQVYSCRCEFTFKHVHKDLRLLKWKNPWARK